MTMSHHARTTSASLGIQVDPLTSPPHPQPGSVHPLCPAAHIETHWRPYSWTTDGYRQSGHEGYRQSRHDQGAWQPGSLKQSLREMRSWRVQRNRWPPWRPILKWLASMVVLCWVLRWTMSQYAAPAESSPSRRTSSLPTRTMQLPLLRAKFVNLIPTVKAVNQHDPSPEDTWELEGVPRVERVTLSKLKYIELQAGWIDEDEVEMRVADRLPPSFEPARGYRPLYNIPDPRYRPRFSKMHLSDEDEKYMRQITLQPFAELDAELCPSQRGGCKFLLPAWIGEQETKAQLHLYQLGILARALNRTLVLPNVSRARLTSCGARSFDFYYESNAMARLLGAPTISFNQFANWTRYRDSQPSAEIVSIERGLPAAANAQFRHHIAVPPEDWSRIPSKPKRRLCLDQRSVYLDFSQHAPVTISPAADWQSSRLHTAQFARELVAELQGGTAVTGRHDDAHVTYRSDPNILMINYELRHPILRPVDLDGLIRGEVQSFRHFEYSGVWQDIAHQIVESLGPFVAIHWRQETLPSAIIQPCVNSLIDKLEQLKSGAEMDIKTVYMATDYPLHDLQTGKEGVSAHSDTFTKLITEEHHVAMTAFLRLFEKRLRKAYGVRLATLSSEQGRLLLPHSVLLSIEPETRPCLTDLDSGITGIIDKIVLARADVFLAATPLKGNSNLETACGKRSSFTSQIIEQRKQTRLQPVGNKQLRSERKAPKSMTHAALTICPTDTVEYWWRPTKQQRTTRSR